MGAIGRIAWIGQAWLTAAMMLLGGIPHFSCLCPDGHIKPFCLGTASATSGCCCHGSCCRAQNVAPSCCQHQDRHHHGSPGKQQAVRRSGCTKTLAPSEVLALSHSKTIVGKKDLTSAACLPHRAVAVVALPAAAGCRPAWQSHQIAPPTDLVTALQHFLI